MCTHLFAFWSRHLQFTNRPPSAQNVVCTVTFCSYYLIALKILGITNSIFSNQTLCQGRFSFRGGNVILTKIRRSNTIAHWKWKQVHLKQLLIVLRVPMVLHQLSMFFSFHWKYSLASQMFDKRYILWGRAKRVDFSSPLAARFWSTSSDPWEGACRSRLLIMIATSNSATMCSKKALFP